MYKNSFAYKQYLEAKKIGENINKYLKTNNYGILLIIS